jgi:hypothetical protein
MGVYEAWPLALAPPHWSVPKGCLADSRKSLIRHAALSPYLHVPKDVVWYRVRLSPSSPQIRGPEILAFGSSQ